jgi:hypothetical protein
MMPRGHPRYRYDLKNNDWVPLPAGTQVEPAADEKKRANELAKARREEIWFASLVALAPPVLVLAFGSALAWAFKGFSLTSKGADARSGRRINPERPYSEMLEAARRKLSEAQFFHRRLMHERDGRLVESEAGAFRQYLSAFLSAGESVRYALKSAADRHNDRMM